MKKLTLFLTLSLLSVIGISTVVKAESPEINKEKSVVIDGEAEAYDEGFEEAQSEEETGVMTSETGELDHTTEEAAELHEEPAE